jgi:predicted amidohydrolase YtcJ
MWRSALPERGPSGPLFVLFLLVACSPSERGSEPQSGPDTVFLNGKVLTIDAEFSIVEAVAVTGNKISAVGSSNELAGLAGDNTTVIDLDGKTMTPGLIDAHNHLIYNAAIWPNNARLEIARTRKEALQILADKAGLVGPGDDADHIVFGFGGWKPLQFSDDPSPFTRTELDAVLPAITLSVICLIVVSLLTQNQQQSGENS